MGSADSEGFCAEGRGEHKGGGVGERGWEMGDKGSRWRGRGERGIDSGEKGAMSTVSCSVLTGRDSLEESSWFSAMRAALSMVSWLLVAWRRALSAKIRFFSSRSSRTTTSMSSIWTRFLSLAVCAATLFFNFLLINLSSGER